MKRLIILCAVLLAGCTTSEDAEIAKKRGKARLDVFRQCMELAAKNGRQSDDKVSKVVDECTTSSYYMTNYIR